MGGFSQDEDFPASACCCSLCPRSRWRRRRMLFLLFLSTALCMTSISMETIWIFSKTLDLGRSVHTFATSTQPTASFGAGMAEMGTTIATQNPQMQECNHGMAVSVVKEDVKGFEIRIRINKFADMLRYIQFGH